jgi:predicted dinucleotide-binding enzyme
MNIGIIGAGNVGGGLGKAWARHGHRVLFGVRDRDKDSVRALLAEAGPNASAASVAEAVAFGEVVVLAVGWGAVEDVLMAAEGWDGKVLIDATNRFSDIPRSAAEDVAAMAPGAKVVKAFNTIGAEHIAAPQFGAVRASMFICGDDPDALGTVAGLAADLGFEPVDCGPLANAALLEAVARLWVYLAHNKTGREIAFALLQREGGSA